MITHEEYLRALEIVKKYQAQINNHKMEVDAEVSDVVSKFAGHHKDMRLDDVNISVRLFNVLRYNHPVLKKGGFGEWPPISVLENLSITDFLKYRCAGPKMVKELRELCNQCGIRLTP